MRTFDHVKRFFGVPLDVVAKEYGYSDENICILRGEEQKLKEDHPAAYQNILSCLYQADHRSPIEYAQDLVASWLIEDHYLILLNQDGLCVSLHGADKNRTVLPRRKTSASCDFIASFQGNNRRCELMNDYSMFWATHAKLHLRDEKYAKLKRENALLLAISVANEQFALIDFSQDVPAKYIPHHRPYGYKPAYEIKMPKEYFTKATAENMTRAIKSAIE